MNNRMTNALWGIIFVLLGVIFAGNAMELWNLNLFFDGWWTVFIIVPSLMGLFQNGSRTGSIIGLVIGVMLLLSAQGFMDWSMMGRMIFPIIFIIIGLNIIFRGPFRKDKNYYKVNGTSRDGVPEYTAAFGSNDVVFPYEEFHGANITSIFGGVDLNLKNAIINKDVVINSTSVFGGVNIIVPPNVNVKVSSIPIFGGTSNKTNPYKESDIPTVYINSTCIFGGAEIK